VKTLLGGRWGLGAGGRGGRGGFTPPPPPLLRRMTFYFVLVYGTYREIKKKENKKTKEFSSGYSPKEAWNT